MGGGRCRNESRRQTAIAHPTGTGLWRGGSSAPDSAERDLDFRRAAARGLAPAVRLLSLDDFAAAQAGGADAHALALAVDLGVHRAQIDVPAPLGDVVGVADAVSRLRLLAADITLLCHDCSRFLMGLYAKLPFYRTNALSANPHIGFQPVG